MVSAFSQLRKTRQAIASLPTTGGGHEKQATSRFLATGASRGVAHHFTTGAFPSRAAAGDGGSANGPALLIEQMTTKVRRGEELLLCNHFFTLTVTNIVLLPSKRLPPKMCVTITKDNTLSPPHRYARDSGLSLWMLWTTPAMQDISGTISLKEDYKCF